MFPHLVFSQDLSGIDCVSKRGAQSDASEEKAPVDLIDEGVDDAKMPLMPTIPRSHGFAIK